MNGVYKIAPTKTGVWAGRASGIMGASDICISHQSNGVKHMALETDRKTEILFAADNIIADEGLDGLNIRNILKYSRVNRRGFYDIFSCKDDLVLAILSGSIGRLAETCRQMAQQLNHPLDRLKLIIMHIVEGPPGREEAPLRRLRRAAALGREHIRLAEARPNDLQRALAPLLDLLSEYLAQGMKEGQVRDYEPHRLARMVYNVVSTTLQTQIMEESWFATGEAERVRLADEIWEFCRRAIIR